LFEEVHMPYGFLDALTGSEVVKAQVENGSRHIYETSRSDRAFDRFTAAEADFIASRDSFYIASIAETGWPYVQHRGGPKGFLKMLGDRTLAFADFRGNRQYITLGNTRADNRVALILMDYANRARLKVLAKLEVRDLKEDPALAEYLALPGYRALPERAMLLHLKSFDWNCPQHITPRFTSDEVADAMASINEQFAALQAENRSLKAELATLKPSGEMI
jgi:predicted pyridoxine 5'-phosphate oxidase superfamily flavin-nucleotide-binding protein